MIKDILGNELAVGDMVAYVSPYYHHLKTAKVRKVTPKGVSVEDVNRWTRKPAPCFREACQVVKVAVE